MTFVYIFFFKMHSQSNVFQICEEEKSNGNIVFLEGGISNVRSNSFLRQHFNINLFLKLKEENSNVKLKLTVNVVVFFGIDY